MRSFRLLDCCAFLSCLLLTASFASAQVGPGPFAAFPSSNPNDGRFLGFGCEGIQTLELDVSLALSVPSSTTNFTLSFFDGDTGGVDGSGAAHWDVGSRQLVFSLYADPFLQGSQAAGDLIARWTGNDPNPLVDPVAGLWTAASASMPDNDWWGAEVTTSAAARAPSGLYHYNLVIGLDGACNVGEILESNVKIASSNPMTFQVPSFGLVAALRNTLNDAAILYPGLDLFGPDPRRFVDAVTTYDGTFTFFFNVGEGATELNLYDGDFDHGTDPATMVGLPSGVDLVTCGDDDDLDTPADYSNFPFMPTAIAEGANALGAPPDDSRLDIFRRGEPGNPDRLGCVRYEVTDPLGATYRNDNPSGNREWEQFRIVSQLNPDAGDSTMADVTVTTPELTPGIWSVKIFGLDLANLNFWFADTCSIRTSGEGVVPACPNQIVFFVGDTVWNDLDGDGVQTAGEAGIPGVILELVDGDGNVVDRARTFDIFDPTWNACLATNTGLDFEGSYCFGVGGAGPYTVRVAASNFDVGGALEGLQSTTGGEEQSNTLVSENIYTYDFGYNVDGPTGGGGGQGCTPGYWKQRHHLDSWVGYSPDDSFAEVFGVPASKSITLLKALKTGGGQFKALGRHAVAALLNSANGGVDYLYSTSEVIALVQGAYASGDWESAKDLLANENEMGCPLN